jgi:hypothetical protein
MTVRKLDSKSVWKMTIRKPNVGSLDVDCTLVQHFKNCPTDFNLFVVKIKEKKFLMENEKKLNLLHEK